MDPLCHTLVGAALGQTGLARRSRYGAITLIVAANLPDVDVLAHFAGDTASYAFRRGITHGLPALVILPFLLAGAVLLIHRLRGSPAGEAAVSPGGLLLLSGIGVLTHPALDWLNTYGMRWLMPIRDVWFYGDTLFIMDWVMWLVLAAGAIAAYRSRRRPAAAGRPAIAALATILLYIAANFALTGFAERRALAAVAGRTPDRVLASPVPFNPLRREIVLEFADHYRLGSFDPVAESMLTLKDERLPKGNPDNLELAAATQSGRWFMHWVRFPYSVETRRNGKTTIRIADARYVPDIDNPRLDNFAVYEFELPASD